MCKSLTFIERLPQRSQANGPSDSRLTADKMLLLPKPLYE
jgi:hypothetical protein